MTFWIIANIAASIVVLSIGIIFSLMVIDGFGKKPEIIIAIFCLALGITSSIGSVWIGVNFWAGS